VRRPPHLSETFCRDALADRPSALLRGFVAVENGRYVGVGTILSLLRAATAEAEARAQEMSQTLERLATAEAEARAACRAKNQFLAVMSHELRTPMNGVLAVAELLHRQPLQGDSAGYVQTIVDSSQTLLRILSDAIDLSRADAMGLDLAPEPTLLRILIDEVQALWLPPGPQGWGEPERVPHRRRGGCGPDRCGAAEAGVQQPDRKRPEVHPPRRGSR
jgi:signal transduction histidine kinase